MSSCVSGFITKFLLKCNHSCRWQLLELQDALFSKFWSPYTAVSVVTLFGSKGPRILDYLFVLTALFFFSS